MERYVIQQLGSSYFVIRDRVKGILVEDGVGIASFPTQLLAQEHVRKLPMLSEEIEPPEPDMNADGPAERADREQKSRGMK